MRNDVPNARLNNLQKYVDDPAGKAPFLRGKITNNVEVNVVVLGLRDGSCLITFRRENNAAISANLANCGR